MKNLNQKGIAQWIVILILAIALPATLLLVRQTQILKPKAATPQCINSCLSDSSRYPLTCDVECNYDTTCETDCNQGRLDYCTNQVCAQPSYICGNNICDVGENHTTCPADCTICGDQVNPLSYCQTSHGSDSACAEGAITGPGPYGDGCTQATPPPPPPPPPPPNNYCEQAGYHLCDVGTPTGGSCVLNGETCTAYEAYACNFNGQNYCGNSPTCGTPCSPPPGSNCPGTTSCYEIQGQCNQAAADSACGAYWNDGSRCDPNVPGPRGDGCITPAGLPTQCTPDAIIGNVTCAPDCGSCIAGTGPAYQDVCNSQGTGPYSAPLGCLTQCGACVGTPPTTSSQQVSATDNSFTPASLTVDPGTIVVWTNNGSNPHTVTADSGPFDSGSIAPGATFSYQFNTPGTYPYHCSFHGGPGGIGMSGTITVSGGNQPPPPPPPPTGGTGRGATVSISPTGNIHVYVNNPYDISAYAIGNNLKKIEIWARKDGGSEQRIAFADDFVNPSSGSLGDLERSPPSAPTVAGQGAIESGCRGQYLTPGGPLQWSCWAYNVKWKPTETGTYKVYLKVYDDQPDPVCSEDCPADTRRPGNAGYFTADVTSGRYRADGLKPINSGGWTGVFVNCVEDPNGRFGSFYECAGSYDIYCCSSGCTRQKNQFTGLDDSCWLQVTNQCQSILTPEGNACGPAACYSFGFPGGVQCVTSGIYGGGGGSPPLPPTSFIQGPNGPIYSGGGYPPGYVPGGTGGGAICPPVLYGKPSSGGVYTPDPGLFCGYYMPAGGDPSSITYVKNIGIAWDAGSGAGAQCSGAQSWKATVDGSPLTGLNNSACFNVLNATFANKAFPATDANQNHNFTVTSYSDLNCTSQLGSPATLSLNSGPACPAAPPANPTVLYRCESGNQCVSHPIGQLLGGYSLLSGCQVNCGANNVTPVPPPPPPPPAGTSPQSVRIINVAQGQCNDSTVNAGRLFATNSSQNLLIRNSDGSFSLNQSWDVTTTIGTGTGVRTVCAKFYSDTSGSSPLGSVFFGDINYQPGGGTPPPPPPPPPTGGTCTSSNGDANRDGDVTLVDHNIWRDEYLGRLSTKTADFNCDGNITLIDHNIWRDEFRRRHP